MFIFAAAFACFSREHTIKCYFFLVSLVKITWNFCLWSLKFWHSGCGTYPHTKTRTRSHLCDPTCDWVTFVAGECLILTRQWYRVIDIPTFKIGQCASRRVRQRHNLISSSIWSFEIYRKTQQYTKQHNKIVLFFYRLRTSARSQFSCFHCVWATSASAMTETVCIRLNSKDEKIRRKYLNGHCTSKVANTFEHGVSTSRDLLRIDSHYKCKRVSHRRRRRRRFTNTLTQNRRSTQYVNQKFTGGKRIRW